MDAVSPPPLDVSTEPRRGGFWRRWLAAVIDILIVMLPFSALAAILFSVTAGKVQMDGGLFTSCTLSREVPAGLDPPPPHDSNFSRVCHAWFLTAKTGGVLTVGRTAREGAMTTTVTQGYMIDGDDKPIKGFAIDEIVWPALVAYLVTMIVRSGQSFGCRALKLRVIDTANPSLPGVPLRKAFWRYPAMMIGWVPAFALLIWRLIAAGGSADAMFTNDFFSWIIAALLLGALWAIVLIVQIARKTDPYYDRLAGTAVIRTSL